jgi:hypothetical protein
MLTVKMAAGLAEGRLVPVNGLLGGLGLRAEAKVVEAGPNPMLKVTCGGVLVGRLVAQGDKWAFKEA